MNQPITALVSYLRASEILAAPLVSKDQRLDATLAKAVGEAIRASDGLRRLRDFYQGGNPKNEEVSIQACCATVARAIESRLHSERVALEIDVEPNVPTILSDAIQLQIVLHNMLSNAIDALAAKGASDRRIALHIGSQSGQIELSVEDSGDAVAPEALPALFEPFNTTKVDGMGLGLAISRSLVRSLAGELIYERSARLGGACFRLTLPVEESVSGISRRAHSDFRSRACGRRFSRVRRIS